jgi:hypothetical protein
MSPPANNPAPASSGPGQNGAWPAGQSPPLQQGVDVPAAGDMQVTVSGATVLPSNEEQAAPAAAPPGEPTRESNLNRTIDAGRAPTTAGTGASDPSAAPPAPPAPAEQPSADEGNGDRNMEPASAEAALTGKTTPPAEPEQPLAEKVIEAARAAEAASDNADAPRDLTSASSVSEVPADAPVSGEEPPPSTETEPAAESKPADVPEVVVPSAPPPTTTTKAPEPPVSKPSPATPSNGATSAGEAGAEAGRQPESSAAPGATRLGYRIQVTAVPDPAVANEIARGLAARLGMTVPVYVDYVRPFYKVRVGDFPTRAGMQPLVDRLRSMGFPDAWTVRSTIRDNSL